MTFFIFSQSFIYRKGHTGTLRYPKDLKDGVGNGECRM